MDKMKIDIWSDIACPFCYIGKRKLEMALAEFPHSDKIELVWHSYELNPNLPKKALEESIYSYFSRTHGGSENDARNDLEPIVKLAKTVGLEYNFDKTVVANTSDALRFAKLAATIDKASEAEEILFKAYFVEGENVSDRNNLIEWGKQLGLKEADIANMLDSDMYLDDIKKDIQYSENVLNLQFIPFYLFNNKHVIQGSLANEEYLRILNQAYEEWERGDDSTELGESISGQSCSIDGHCS